MTQTNLLLSGMLFVLMVTTPLYAPLARRYEKKKIMMVAIFFLFIAVLLSAFATNYYWLLLSRVMQGIFIPGITAIMLSYVQEIYPKEHRGLGMGIYMAATGFGAVIGRLLAGWITYLYSWQEAFGFFAFLLLVALLAMAWGLPRTKLDKNSKVKVKIKALQGYLVDGQILSILLIPMVVFFTFMAVTTFVTYHLVETPFLLNASQLGNLFLILLLAVLVSPLAGRYSDKIGRVKILYFGLFSLIIGVLLTLSGSLFWIVVGVGFVTIGMFTVQSVTPTYLGDIIPNDKGTIAVLYQSFFYLGGALGTLVPAWAWEYGSYEGVVILCLILIVLGSSPLIYYFFKNKEKNAN
jgi:YNFM family putative membrane transporter